MDIKNQLQDRIKVFLVNIICDRIMKSELRNSENTYQQLENMYTNTLFDAVASDLFGEEREEWIRDRIAENMNIGAIRRQVIDYVNMCFRTKTKVRLDVRSVRQAINLHDALAGNRSHYQANTAPVKIPKNSKFNALRDILPDEFEWIKNKKRLVIKTELQHHCVWSYADKITNDKCAIYSYVDKDSEHSDDGRPKRYTIEFVLDKNGRYKISQVQGKYDREHTKAMEIYIQELLDGTQNNTQQK